jgi:hypothetical protein
VPEASGALLADVCAMKPANCNPTTNAHGCDAELATANLRQGWERATKLSTVVRSGKMSSSAKMSGD